MSKSPVCVFNFFDSILSPMPADKTAKGGIPAAGLQYCEALTAASSFGFYVFPPMDVKLRWTGGRIQYSRGEDWIDLDQLSLPAECVDRWRELAPPAHRDRLPPFLQRFFLPEVVQLWTGLFVVCEPDWSILVRPIANTLPDERVMTFEGLVEADVFQPLPLFINLKFLSRNAEVRLERYVPLFQLQPIPRTSYASPNIEVLEFGSGSEPENNSFPWDGLSQTTRLFSGEGQDLELGNYKKIVRSRRRRGSAK